MGLTDYFTYDGEKSSDYGFYASGEGVFNSPEKDYEMVEIPGRNGDVAIDKHRFKNIGVTYPCIIGMVGEDFKSAMSDFRNMLMSKSGYCRLEDTHNPDEFRLGVCKDIIEVNPTGYDLISNVNVVFDCKPQRFLKTGENIVTVASGGTLTNPTAFPSTPLLMVEGYGDININDDVITIQDSPMGSTLLTEEKTSANLVTSPYVTNLYYDSDAVTLGSSLFWCKIPTTEKIFSYSYSDTDPEITSVSMNNTQAYVMDLVVNIGSISDYFNAGTNKLKTITMRVRINLKDEDNQTITVYGTISFKIRRNEKTFQAEKPTVQWDETQTAVVDVVSYRTTLGATYVDSTYSALGNPLYLDLQNGQAYKYDDGVYTSVNNAVWLGAELPTLKAGANTITYEEDIHSLKVVPRWWKV